MKKPAKPSEPKKPSPTRAVQRCVELANYHTLEGIIETLPKDVKFSDIKFHSETCYDEMYAQFVWDAVEPNPNYARELEYYDLQMAAYPEKLKKYEEKMLAFNAWVLSCRPKHVESLKSRLEEAEKQAKRIKRELAELEAQ